MAETTNIAAYAGGRWSVLSGDGKVRETVLALPLNRLIAKIVFIPAENSGDPIAFAEPVLAAMSPYADEPLAVSVENLRETVDGSVALAAALPEGSVADIEEALDAQNVNVTRVDSLAFGSLQSAWADIPDDGARRLLLVEGDESIAAFVADGRSPCAVRALSPGPGMASEIMKTLLQAEGIGGAKALSEIVVAPPWQDAAAQDAAAQDAAVPQGEGADGESAAAAPATLSEDDCRNLSAFAPVRRLGHSLDPLPGLLERAADPSSLNVLPDTWGEILDETRFSNKTKRFLFAVGGLWLAVLATLFAVPWVYGYRTDKMETLRRQHRAEFRKVSEKKAQVEAVRSVSNHDLGALETMRVVTSVFQENMELSKWNFKRGDKLTFSGTVADGNERKVYTFKDGLSGIRLSQVSGFEDDDETPFFTGVALPRGVSQRGGKAVFDVECDFKAQEEEE